MKILVTGATGNVGAPLVHELGRLGVDTRAFVRDPEKARQRLGDEVELAVGDFADPGSMQRALDGVDRVFLACGNVPGQVDHGVRDDRRRPVGRGQPAGQALQS